MNRFMKKYIVKAIAAVVFTALSVLFAFDVIPSEAAASASLSGPSEVRVGDTVTVSFKLNGTKLQGLQGELQFDSSQLTYGSMSKKIADPWIVEISNNKLVAYDNNLTAPINSEKELFTVSFTVKNVPVGTKITVSVRNLVASDGTADAEIGTASCTFTVVPPLSSDNALARLTVSNAAIRPDFSPETLNYTAEVPYEVSKLEVSASAAHGNAKVSVSSPELAVNGTTEVKITVTAENGSTKIYTIKVHRAQDPNYVPSGNNTLRSITVNGFLLSPAFSAEITDYIVWAPYETEKVSLTAVPEDGGASVRIEGAEELLLPGADNVIKVICIAENGAEKVYTVTVKRAVSHEELNSTPSPEATEPPSAETPTPPQTEVPATSAPTADVTAIQTPEAGAGSPDRSTGFFAAPGWTILFGVVILLAGIAIGAFLMMFVKREK